MGTKDKDGDTSLIGQRRKISPQEAREAAAEAIGFLASITIVAGGEEFVVPQRSLLDDDQRERMDELDLETESWDREPDIEYPARVLKDKDGNETHWPARTEPGSLKVPYRKGNKLIKPPYPVRVAIALWGEETYNRYKAKGGRATDITGTLARLDRVMVEREQGDGDTPPDPKSVGGSD